MPETHEFPELEAGATKLAEKVANILREHRREFPKIGAIVFLMDLGPSGGFAYQSTIVREDAIRSLIEFIRHQLSSDVLGPDQYDRGLYHQANVLYQMSRRPGDEDYVPR